MNTIKAILMEHAAEMAEELEELFDADTDEIEVKFKLNYWGENPKIEVNKIKCEVMAVEM